MRETWRCRGDGKRETERGRENRKQEERQDTGYKTDTARKEKGKPKTETLSQKMNNTETVTCTLKAICFIEYQQPLTDV